jgi:hypothetical protein
MQWGPLAEEKQKNELATNKLEVRFKKTMIMIKNNNNDNNKGRQVPALLRLYISVAL